MTDFNTNKTQSNLLVLFVPSADRYGESLGKKEQNRWVRKALKLLGEKSERRNRLPARIGRVAR